MLTTPSELAEDLGARIKARRLAFNLTQIDAASRSGVSYATWRRLEASGAASIEDLARAAILLRCEEALTSLFPLPAATSMDELLAAGSPKKRAKRVRQLKPIVQT